MMIYLGTYWKDSAPAWRPGLASLECGRDWPSLGERWKWNLTEAGPPSALLCQQAPAILDMPSPSRHSMEESNSF